MTLSDTVKRLLISIGLHFFIALMCGMLINAVIKFDTQASFISGLVLGASLSVIKLLLMERGISKSLSMQTIYAGLYTILQITLRNVFSIILLVCALLIEGISIWGVLAGLILLQSAAFSVSNRSIE